MSKVLIYQNIKPQYTEMMLLEFCKVNSLRGLVLSFMILGKLSTIINNDKSVKFPKYEAKVYRNYAPGIL